MMLLCKAICHPKMVLLCAVFLVLIDVAIAVMVPNNCSAEVMIVQNPESDSAVQSIEMYSDLGSISDNVANNTEVWICSSVPIILDSMIVLTEVSNISIHGYDDAIILCQNDTEAGFLLTSVQQLTIADITIENCVVNSTIDSSPDRNLGASIVIQHSSDVVISNVSVLNGPGTGLAMFDIEGTINVTDSTFEGNGQDKFHGGSGLYLEISSDSSINSSCLTYTFKRCKFVNNMAESGRDSRISGFSRFDKGGGICIFLRSLEGVSIIIEDATISGNTALTYGGGVYATFHNDAKNSEIIVRGSNYTRNKARYGGGHYSGYLHRRVRNQTPLSCSHVFTQNLFFDNHAIYGGGVSVFSTKTKVENPDGRVDFEDCTWRGNSGQFGSAIAILPNAWNINTDGYLPTVYFSGSVIDSNRVTDYLDSETTLVRQYTKGSGALFCTHHTLEFSSHNSFRRNNGSAFYMGSCIARFSKYSKTVFRFNKGYHGGAIYQISSVLFLFENIEMIFDSNFAYGQGGAVYHTSYNFHMYDYSRTCLFSYRGYTNLDDRNITITFINNAAGTATGHSVYAYSLLPCFRLFRFSIGSVTPQIFDEIGNVTYVPPNRDMEIATAASSAIKKATENASFISVLPGQEIQLPYSDVDDLGQVAQSVYLVTVESHDNSTVKVDEAYTYISTNQVLIYGDTESNATLMLSSYQSRQRSVIVNITMLPCPPGYKLSTENSTQCVCAYGTDSQYTGIEYCREETWQAYRRRGYWIGYIGNQTEDESNLVTGHCPIGFCSHSKDLRLPSTADRAKLNSIICSSRRGVLCGKCASNHSVFYHSLHFTCKSDKYCDVGWLLYILSEIVPVTIIFLVIIFFNITFTSGNINGFIFFAQVVVVFHVGADDFIPLPNGVKVFNRVLHFFYLIFNLNLFTLDEMSFCLFRNATALDVIAFSYVTLIYALFLIIGIILLMNKLNIRYCCKPLRKCIGPQWQTFQGSVIHGLSAFLVLCYAKCAQTSILLISSANTRGKGGKTLQTVVFYNGDITWFSIPHLPYAIPAIFMILVLVILPPIILFIYPLHYKFLTALRISEAKCTSVLLKPLDKLKPLLDSFQGSFKDEYRFFSGLYFVYRFSILVGVTLSMFQEIYFIILGLLLVVLVLHAVFQPYKERAHNIIDTLLFTNLAVINGITMYNFSNIKTDVKTNTTTAFLGYTQSILIGLPLFIVILCLLKKVFQHVHILHQRKAKIRKEQKEDHVEEEELPARMLYSAEDLISSGSFYQQLK